MQEAFPYIMACLGFLGVYVLNGIKSEIRDVKTTVKALEADMRGGIGNLDRRVTTIETRCSMEHRCLGDKE